MNHSYETTASRVRVTITELPDAAHERLEYEQPQPGGHGPGEWLVCLRAEANAYRFGFCLVPGQVYRSERNRRGLSYETCVTVGGEHFVRRRFRQATEAELEAARIVQGFGVGS